MKKYDKLEKLALELADVRASKKELAEREKGIAAEVHEELNRLKVEEYDGDDCKVRRVESTVYSITTEALQESVGWKKALECCKVQIGKVKEHFGADLVKEIGEADEVYSLKVEQK